MPDRVGPKADGRIGAAAGSLIWFAVGVALIATVLISQLAQLQPSLPGRAMPSPVTTIVSALGDLTARLAAVTTLGALVGVAAFTVAGADATLDAPAHRLTRWAGRSAQIWFAASVLMTFANPAFLNGTPIGGAFRPGDWWLSVRLFPSALAWLVSALVALLTALVTYRGRHRGALFACWLLGAAALIFVDVTGNVSVGLDHDWATDAAGVGTTALVLLAGGAVGAVAASVAGSEQAREAVRRYQHWAPLPILVLAATQVLVGWQQLAGTSPLNTLYGLPFLVSLGCLVLLAASWLVRRFTGRGVASLAWDVALVVLFAATQTAAGHVSPPRFWVPQSIQVNYLGYDVERSATVARLAGLGRPNLLWVVLTLSAVGLYVWGVVRVRRAGGTWPTWRLVLWISGWALTCYLAVSGLWEYSTAVYSWHMLVHMTINMMVPVLCVQGDPVALISAASADEDGMLPTVHRMLAELAGQRVVKVLLSPPLVWLVYVGSLFAVYFSPAFAWLMKYHWAHQLMLLHFMIVGLAFFTMVAGPANRVWHLPYLMRFALLVSVMPFHAIFAVGIMSSRSLIGGNFYRSLDVSWVGDLMADQDIAGQITWFTGEAPALVAVIALGAQWFLSDRAEDAAADRSADLSGDTELSAYNDMLAELAARDQAQESVHEGGER